MANEEGKKNMRRRMAAIRHSSFSTILQNGTEICVANISLSIQQSVRLQSVRLHTVMDWSDFIRSIVLALMRFYNKRWIRPS